MVYRWRLDAKRSKDRLPPALEGAESGPAQTDPPWTLATPGEQAKFHLPSAWNRAGGGGQFLMLSLGSTIRTGRWESPELGHCDSALRRREAEYSEKLAPPDGRALQATDCAVSSTRPSPRTKNQSRAKSFPRSFFFFYYDYVWF